MRVFLDLLFRSKLVTENQTPARLLSSRLYKENRVNWNENKSGLIDMPKDLGTNWATPAWNERQSSRSWNQSQTNLKNSRKVSAKQHYLSVARYVAGQSTNLSSRYRTYRNLAPRILLIAWITLALACLLSYSDLVPKNLRDSFISITATIAQKIHNVFTKLELKKPNDESNFCCCTLHAICRWVRSAASRRGRDFLSVGSVIIRSIEGLVDATFSCANFFMDFGQKACEIIVLIIKYILQLISAVVILVSGTISLEKRMAIFCESALKTILLTSLETLAYIPETVSRAFFGLDDIPYQGTAEHDST